MYDVASIGFRAGFWRRLFGFVIDCVIVGLAFQLLAAWLYSASGGSVQGPGFFTECSRLQTSNQDLDPPPPPQSNFGTVCKSSLFGFTTSQIMIVGRATHEGHTNAVISQTYHLGNDGQPIKALDLAWVSQLALFAYLVMLECRSGATLGERMLGLTVVSWTSPGSTGIPIVSAIIRQLAKCLGLVPFLALVLYHYVNNDIETLLASSFLAWSFAIVAAGVWGVWNLVLTVTKRDPIYDRLARVSVLRG
jgi:uncharacterized RDD family membrane protein YckC